jgi:hypothetical protein
MGWDGSHLMRGWGAMDEKEEMVLGEKGEKGG